MNRRCKGGACPTTSVGGPCPCGGPAVVESWNSARYSPAATSIDLEGPNCMDSPIACETLAGARVVRGERREFHEGNVWESTTEDVSVRGKLLQVSHPLKSRQLQHRSSQPVQLPITAGLL